MNDRPLVLTLGDPAGIGPEITFKAWQILRDTVPFVVLGDIGFLDQIALSHRVPLHSYTAGTSDCSEFLQVIDHPLACVPVPGTPELRNAAAVVTSIEAAVRHVQSGLFSALVTNPVSKAVLKSGAGFAFPGHTEFLAALAGGGITPVMMLATPELRVVPVTSHVPLAEVPKALTAKLLEVTIRTTQAALIAHFAIRKPRLAVAGLNPHAGESGTMGREEIETIIPVLDRLRAQGFDLSGPVSADTMFHKQAREKYDAAICMYHDQALIPVKTLDFSNGVNVTLGLPFIRTSPDHGTAFAIAGSGVADPSSLVAALRLAWDMARA